MSKRTSEVVVVTGASAGVGRAIVRAFARRGACIDLLARGQEGLEGARREVEELGAKRWLRRPMSPVPPIYQPEVIADAVTYLANHSRRELFVGFSTVKVIQANKIAPGQADHYLAKTGYASQQTTEPEDPDPSS